MLATLIVAIPAYAIAPRSGSETPVAEEQPHLALANPIEVSLVAASSPSVGVPLQVTATLRAQWVSLTAVGVSIAAPPGVDIVGTSKLVVPVLPLGETRDVTFLLIPRTPGLHLVHVDASARSDLGPVGGYRQAYLDLPASGAGAFHVDHVPVSEYAQPAVQLSPDAVVLPSVDVLGVGDAAPSPTTAIHRPLPPGWSGEGAAASGGGPSAPTFTVSGCWMYETENAGTFSVQRWAQAEVWDADSGFDDDVLWTGILDSNGCFTSGSINSAEPDCCGRGNQDIYVRFVACNSATCVTTTGGVAYDGFTPITNEVSSNINVGTWTSPTTERFAWRPFQYTNNAWDFTVNRAGFSASFGSVTVHIPDSCTFYTLGTDTIHLCANGVDDRSPDDVGHEYGHFVMDKAYGDAYWPSPNGAHSFCQDNQNRGLSWAEGFGDYWGPRIDNEISPTPGATGDVNYNRPWNGAQFSWSVESVACAAQGDDDEWNVAAAMWDLRDSVNDGFDSSSSSASLIASVVRNCDDFSYNDYYNGGGAGANSPACNWTNQGGNACNFVTTAWQNRIDFNAPPTASVTTQTSFAWHRGTITIGASLTDPEGCTTGNSVTFQISHDSTCNGADTAAGSDSTSPYSVSFSTPGFADDASVWTCARPSDGMENGNWVASSSSIGIDNTPPTGSVSAPATGTSLGYTVSWSTSDATSGISGSVSLQERPPAGSFSTVCSGGASGSCTRAPLVPGQYCYRVVANDAAGNSFTSAESCTVVI